MLIRRWVASVSFMRAKSDGSFEPRPSVPLGTTASRIRVSIGSTMLLMMSLEASSASALSYTFSQGGYFTGASVYNGSFSGVDSNSDGYLSSLDGEITSFGMAFQSGFVPPGNLVGGFFVDLSGLNGLVYEIGGGFLGDGTTNGGEGLAIAANGGLIQYYSGYRFAGGPGASVTNFGTFASDSTLDAIVVAAIPEPGVALLTGLGLIGLACSRRNERRTR